MPSAPARTHRLLAATSGSIVGPLLATDVEAACPDHAGDALMVGA